MDTNVREKSLVSQRIVYDKITSDKVSISSLVITPELVELEEELKKAKGDTDQNKVRNAKPRVRS